MLELCIPIRVLASLTRLARALQAVAQLVQQLAHQLMGQLVALLPQLAGQLAHALARPAQRRLRVSPRHRLHQSFQILLQAGILAHCFLAPASDPSDASFTHSCPRLQFLDALADGLPREPRRSRDR